MTMADFGAPVAQNVNVNPQQGMTLASMILGLQQQKQQLQTGQYLQQSAAAGAQQDQQKNSELQALNAFTKQATADPAYHNADGSLNVTKYQADALKVAPVYGPQYIGQVTTNANQAVDNRNALLTLSNKQRATISGYFSAVAQKPGATTADLLDAVEQARGVSDDAGYQRAMDSMLLHAPQTLSMPSDQGSAAIRTYAGGVSQGASTAMGAVSQGAAPGASPAGATAVGAGASGANTPLSPAQLDQLRLTAQSAGNAANAPQYASYTGRDQQTHFAQVNPNAPGGIRQDLGTSLPQGMTLSERYSIQPAPNGQLMLTDRQGGRVVPLGGASGAAGPAPSAAPGAPPSVNTGRGGNTGAGRALTADTDPQRPGPNDPDWRQQGYGQLVQRGQHDVLAAQDADAGYGTNMETATMIRRYAADANTGPGTSSWTHYVGMIGSRFGANNVADTQTLGSFLDLQASRLRDSMGLPQTNAGLATSQEMGTSIESQRNAILAKTDYYQALTQLSHEYRLGLDAAGNGGVNPSPTAVSRFKSQFAASADPINTEIDLAQRRGDPNAVRQIVSGLTNQQRAQLVRKRQNMNTLLGSLGVAPNG